MSSLAFRALAAAMMAAPLAFVSAPVSAQGSYSPYDESASNALSRYVRNLASNPRDFSALIGAGRAALAMGDVDAAAGFFARADEASPDSPLPQAGMGAVAVASGDPQTALSYFARAQQLGAPLATFGADRGLAFDLLGRMADAQSDYRAALGGADSDEARRRLALSLAISGNRAAAIEALGPLHAKRDPAAARVRAFVLALTGDSKGAMAAIDAAMPGSWAQVGPFLQRLPGLAPGQKAAAVNLGIFPDASGGYAAASPASADRLSGVDEYLRSTPQPSEAPRAIATSPIQPTPSWSLEGTKVASANIPRAIRQPTPSAPAAPTTARAKRIWLQLASGPNPDALPDQFRRIKSKNREMFDGIKGYVARGSDRSRLLIGPFRNSADAETFAQGLESVNAFRWTNSETDTIVPLAGEGG
jgi:Flp pilus assembly protein TadD